MHLKELFGLILLMQACGPLLAQTPAPQKPEAVGILQSLFDSARGAKTQVQDIGAVALDFAGVYYEENIQPVTHIYFDWASDVKGSVWEKIQTTIQDYSPFKATSPDDQTPQQ